MKIRETPCGPCYNGCYQVVNVFVQYVLYYHNINIYTQKFSYENFIWHSQILNCNTDQSKNIFLKLSPSVIVQMSQTHSLADSLRHILLFRQYLRFFVDWFGRFLRVCNLEFDREAILMVVGVKMAGIGEGFGILSNFRELRFCGPCGPCFNYSPLFQSQLLVADLIVPFLRLISNQS